MKDILFSYDQEYDVCYSSIERAKKELLQRRENQALLRRIRENILVTEELEKVFEKPRLVLFRQIASPLTETERFLKLAKQLSFEPLIFEYQADKFVSASNLFKRGLGKLPIFKFTSPTGVDAYTYKTVVNFNMYTGKPLADVRTTSGELLFSLHHELFKKYFLFSADSITIDLSDWFKHYEDNASRYYEALMTLFLRDAVLCENFVTSSTEEDFFTKVARPSFKKVCETYGLDPLVIRIIPKEEEKRIYWDCYPNAIGEILLEKGYN
ncbi:MAG: hypothetical protein AAB618_01940 [Patescibacteria group bacterium]